MKKSVITIVVISFLGVFASLGCQNEGPTGQAVGHMQAGMDTAAIQHSLVSALQKFQAPFLADVGISLSGLQDDPLKLIQVFDKLMYAVTGPSGFWRAYVPQKYFGCSANHTMSVCKQFERLELSFLPWETFHIQVAGITSLDEARMFLQQNSSKIKGYLAYFVPDDRSLTALKETPFYQDRLATIITD
jgi:hypothetical protein